MPSHVAHPKPHAAAAPPKQVVSALGSQVSSLQHRPCCWTGVSVTSSEDAQGFGHALPHLTNTGQVLGLCPLQLLSQPGYRM